MLVQILGCLFFFDFVRRFMIGNVANRSVSIPLTLGVVFAGGGNMPDEKLEDKDESSWEVIELSDVEELRFCKLMEIQRLMTELLATLTIDTNDLTAIDKLGDSVYEQLKQIASERYKSARKCPALSKRMSQELKSVLRGRTIKDVSVKKEPHQVYIKFVTTEGTIGIGATGTGVRVDKKGLTEEGISERG